MTSSGLSIDDDDKGLGDDDLTLKKVAVEGVRMEEVDCRLHAEFVEFSAVLSTARVLLVAVRGGSDCSSLMMILGLLCQTQGPGGRWRRRRVSSMCWAPCQLSPGWWTHTSLSERVLNNNNNNKARIPLCVAFFCVTDHG